MLPFMIHIAVGILIQSMAIFVKNLVMVMWEWVQFPIGIQYIINGSKLKCPTIFRIPKLLGEILLPNIQQYLVWTKVFLECYLRMLKYICLEYVRS